MKFYGFYISKNKENLRKQIIESGVLPFEELIKGKAEKTYSEMLNGIEGKPVFLFSGFSDIKMGDSPFAKYFLEDEYNFESKISENKAYAKGVVQRVNFEDNSIEVDWDKTYQPITWYRFVLTEPIVVFDTENSKHEQIYKIVFENQPMDYEWWTKNGDWKQKLKNEKKALTEDMEKRFKNWLGSQRTRMGNLFSDSPSQVNNLAKDLRETIPSWPAVNIDNVFFETDPTVIKNLYERCRNNGDLQFLSENVGKHRPRNALGQYFKFLNSYLAIDGIEQIEFEDDESISTNTVLNKILYGPPGTGKTFNTVSEALNILGDSEVAEWQGKKPNSIEKLKQAFPGQVEFVTFHQSFSYEDFVEGLRANSDDGNLSYEIEDGVFKKICVEAMFSKLKRDYSVKEVSFSELYDQFLMSVKAKLLEGPYSLATKSEKSLYIRTLSDRETLHIYHEGSEVLHSVGRKRLKRLFDVYPDIEHFDKIKNIHNEITEAIGGANSTVYWSVLNKVLLLKQEMIEQQDDGEDLSVLNYEQKKQELADTENPEFMEGKPHVLIIDEINRGNISRIFGELITLIEDSKRQGCAEAISVKLPYSNAKEIFSVPNNLYIIGTMNTADRSLAMMDTALRRRFDFKEMMPNPCLLHLLFDEAEVTAYSEWEDFERWDFTNKDSKWAWDKDHSGEDLMVENQINLRRLLFAINQRIEALYDREHTIGHAFFMSLNENSTITDLANIFKNKILPLLEEYFYDDWEKIRLVLADQAKSKASGLQFYQEVEGVKQDALFPQSNDSAIPNVNKSYRRQVSLEPEAYIQIYDTSYSNSLDEDDSGE